MPFDFLRYTDKAKRPLVATPGSMGNDLFSTYKYIIPPFHTVLIKTDLVICVPAGYYGLISGRSSVALKGVQTLVGMLDSDYRGLVCIVLTNMIKSDYIIDEGDRIGQLSILRYEKLKWVGVDKVLGLLQRKRGFGSTGK